MPRLKTRELARRLRQLRTTIPLDCTACGAHFDGWSGQKYCTRRCYNRIMARNRRRNAKLRATA